jgi:hypothetical protein
MPPRFAYWTILIDQQPTAFRAQKREDLLPTFTQLQRKNPDIVMKWFARGRLWDSPEQAQWSQRNMPRTGEPRGRDWRPGGEHKDPRARFDKPRPDKPRLDKPPFEKRFNKPPFDKRKFGDRTFGKPTFGTSGSDRSPSDRRPEPGRPKFDRPKSHGRSGRPGFDRPKSNGQKFGRPKFDRPKFDRPRHDRPEGERRFQPKPDAEREPSGDARPPHERRFNRGGHGAGGFKNSGARREGRRPGGNDRGRKNRG